MATHKADQAQLASNARRLAQLAAKSDRFNDRYQKMVVKFYQAQADYTQSAQQRGELQEVLRVKQQVIEVLLAFCPPALTLHDKSALLGGLTA